MISLKQALKLSASQISALRAELKEKIKANNELGAYIEQLTNTNLSEQYSGVPLSLIHI